MVLEKPNSKFISFRKMIKFIFVPKSDIPVTHLWHKLFHDLTIRDWKPIFLGMIYYLALYFLSSPQDHEKYEFDKIFWPLIYKMHHGIKIYKIAPPH